MRSEGGRTEPVRTVGGYVLANQGYRDLWDWAKVVAEKVDLWAQGVEPSGEKKYDVKLREGVNEILVECVGSNPSANPKNYMFGLDYVRIE